ncbi:MAG: hypothetical protein RIT81_45070 [Deltaproteobacteria bacterium]
MTSNAHPRGSGIGVLVVFGVLLLIAGVSAVVFGFVLLDDLSSDAFAMERLLNTPMFQQAAAVMYGTWILGAVCTVIAAILFVVAWTRRGHERQAHTVPVEVVPTPARFCERCGAAAGRDGPAKFCEQCGAALG